MFDDDDDDDDDVMLELLLAAAYRRHAQYGWLIGGVLVILLMLLWPRLRVYAPMVPLLSSVHAFHGIPGIQTVQYVQRADQGAPQEMHAMALCGPTDQTLQCPPSLTPEQIDAILASYGSPALGTGRVWYDLGVAYGIDPAWALAFFIHESSAGTNPTWAGWKDHGRTTHNVGNIICSGYSACYGRFRDYPSWDAGIEDWYRLITVEYIHGRGHRVVADVVPVYAPAFENDVSRYVESVTHLVATWRQGS